MNNIPKKIHYCWFGGKPLPESAIKCINSWKKYCPDYEIIEWNENNFNIAEACDYVKEAYERKKYAFVSDYVRFEVIYKYGGFYFDTDVEIVKPIDDLLEKPFFAIEINNGLCDIATGLGMGSEPGNPIYKVVIDKYTKSRFILEDGSTNANTVVDTITSLFVELGFDQNSNAIQQIDGFTIFPVDYFCPMDYTSGSINITENTYSIHWYNMSWLSDKEKRWQQFSRKYKGKPDNSFVGKIIKVVYCYGTKELFTQILARIKGEH